jgi:hypothetical protein
MATPTDILVNRVFEAVFYPVVAWAFASGYLQDRFPLTSVKSVATGIWDSALMRGASVAVSGQVILTYWEGLIGDQVRNLYPNLPLFTICLASAIVMTSRPAGKLSGAIGATFASTVLFCIVNAINIAIHGRTTWGDLLLWRSGMVSALALVLLLAGAASGQTGKRFVCGIGGVLNELARKKSARKLVR